MHPENLLRVPFKGTEMLHQLGARVDETAHAAMRHIDRPVSVLIRSRNNAERLEELFEDIHMQRFTSEIEVVLVDTESDDGTPELARSMGATVRTIKQEDFNYPRALNMGFEAASHSWVFSLVGNSALSNLQVLHTATRWNDDPRIAGISGIPLPDKTATMTERVASYFMFNKHLEQPARLPGKREMGFLATNCSAIRKEAWEDVGGFDESYGAGGEDGALADTLVRQGYKIMIDPALSVYRSHGVGPIAGLRQLLYWQTTARPQPFDLARLQKFRRDLR